MPLAFLKSAVFGSKGGLSMRELHKLSQRDKFSDYLPWVSYDEETRLFYMSDDTCGFAWECSPLFFASETTVNILEGIFRSNLPEKSVLQFILFADPCIDDILEDYCRLKARQDSIVSLVNENLPRYFKDGKYGLKNMGKIPLRRFRLFFTLKFPEKELESVNLPHIWTTLGEILKGASLFPEPMDASALLEWARCILNDKTSFNNFRYDDNIPIRKQTILGTTIKKSSNRLDFGKRIFRCMTPKSFPPDVDPTQINRLFGGIDGMSSDDNQMSLPFIFTLNVLMENQKSQIHRKTNLILRQQAVGSFAPSLMRKRDEHMWAADELERGTKFLRIVPIFWVYGDDETQVSEALIRARRIWDGEGFVMQEDEGILIPLLQWSLPFGLCDVGSNVNMVDRHYLAPIDTISTCLPVQGDFAGFGNPVALFTGRKGQLFGLDIYSSGANNHNAFVAAESGAGKSFFINYMIYNYYSVGNMIRIIDIGRSYEKATKLFKARYLDFTEDSDVNLNPFTSIVDPEFDVPVIAPIVAQMVFSAGASQPTEVDMNLIKLGVRWAYENEGNDACIDTVHYYLSNFDQVQGSESLEIRESARKLAFNLHNFTSKGVYGRFFNGKSTFNIASDDFCVLELDQLKPRPDLFRVVTMQVVNAVTQELYLSDRSRKRMIFFDEAYQFLGESGHIKGVIEEGYRRARKYGGSFWVITQSILDTKSFGSVGEVILNNSAYKFYMESHDFEKARAEKLVDYDDFTLKILKSLKTKKPNYSEIFMDTPFGKGVGRLLVDPFSYYVFTSSSEEVSEIEAMVDGGVPYEDAIRAMVTKYRS
ncbi:MAG: conjugal transfer protein TraC [Deltaproteobacteria bacterium]|nr:conjugal transfer protein TraC [Deltaproteobacteria bacterium]TLN02316.1 MAG: conjugal transfer protein TraC [bacterium]